MYFTKESTFDVYHLHGRVSLTWTLNVHILVHRYVPYVHIHVHVRVPYVHAPYVRVSYCTCIILYVYHMYMYHIVRVPYVHVYFKRIHIFS